MSATAELRKRGRTVDERNVVRISTHADTQPGTLTLFQPRTGIDSSPAKKALLHAAGERPEAFSP